MFVSMFNFHNIFMTSYDIDIQMKWKENGTNPISNCQTNNELYHAVSAHKEDDGRWRGK